MELDPDSSPENLSAQFFTKLIAQDFLKRFLHSLLILKVAVLCEKTKKNEFAETDLLGFIEKIFPFLLVLFCRLFIKLDHQIFRGK